jgi:hypothetical protein
MSNLRGALAVVAVFCALGSGCSAGHVGVSSETQPPSTVRVSRSGDETFVSVEEAQAEPVNPVCLAYCDRLADCWHARPNNTELMMSRDEVLKRCKGEQAACHTPTTDMLCCSDVSDCYDFNRCVDESRDKVMSCERVRARN